MALHTGKQDATELDYHQEEQHDAATAILEHADHDKERHDAAATILEHTDEYIYEPLPGERWIRVLLLEPAPELECPLVARLELLALDSEKRQLGAPAPPVAVSTLPYTALSYSWALDNGDDSLSHRLTLSNKVVSITQNLSQGLRRIRSKTDSESRLWVDALCINQNNETERSAQVALMFEIFRHAERCIVWLGEGSDQESDFTVWQLSHCISPDVDTGLIPAYPDNAYEIALVVFRGLMAVNKSRCTVHACNGNHPRLDDADFADTKLTRHIQRGYTEDTGDDVG
ncbi:hypothetical protein BST61_g2800 [Cercospora zeina]